MLENLTLADSIEELERYKIITSYHTPLFAKKNLFTIGNLLEHYPVRYEDRKPLITIEEAIKRQWAEQDTIFNLICLCVKKGIFKFKKSSGEKI